VLTDFLALCLFCFNIRQHDHQIFYFKLHVDGCKFHYQRPHAAVRPQVLHRCAKSYRLHNWYNCPSKPFATSHAHACFSLQKSRKSRTMLTALTFTSTSAAYCTSPPRDVEVHGLVVRPITATTRVCFQSCITRSLGSRVTAFHWNHYGAWNLFQKAFMNKTSIRVFWAAPVPRVFSGAIRGLIQGKNLAEREHWSL